MASENARFIGLAHVGVFTKDIEESIRFYTQHLGFEVTHRSDRSSEEGGTRLALLRQGTCVVELIQPADPGRVPAGLRGNVDHFAIEVKGVEQIIEDLRAKGVTFLGDMFIADDVFGGVQGIFLSGPSGEVIELFEFRQ